MNAFGTFHNPVFRARNLAQHRHVHGTQSVAWSPWVLNTLSPTTSSDILHLGVGAYLLYAENAQHWPRAWMPTFAFPSIQTFASMRGVMTDAYAISCLSQTPFRQGLYGRGQFDGVVLLDGYDDTADLDGDLCDLGRIVRAGGFIACGAPMIEGISDVERVIHGLAPHRPHLLEGAVRPTSFETLLSVITENFSLAHGDVLIHPDVLSYGRSDLFLEYATLVFPSLETALGWADYRELRTAAVNRINMDGDIHVRGTSGLARILIR